MKKVPEVNKNQKFLRQNLYVIIKWKDEYILEYVIKF